MLNLIFTKCQFRKSQRIKSLPILMLVGLLGASQPAFSGFFSSPQPSNNSNLNNSQQRFLPVEQAFQLSGQLKGQQLILNWQVEPEHYLYRSRFKVRMLEPRVMVLSDLDIPRGEKTRDEFLGEVETLRHQVSIKAALNISEQVLKQGVVVEVTFQGCADAGLCYPPHSQTLSLVPQR